MMVRLQYRRIYASLGLNKKSQPEPTMILSIETRYEQWGRIAVSHVQLSEHMNRETLADLFVRTTCDTE